ncbi:MAG: isoprenylcysteine carboxylmethyltransferase family protein [Eubacterium sp.]|nr:isoprenylcysteine carboxylmethyltransferase family protein [Eubacterium sp.]
MTDQEKNATQKEKEALLNEFLGSKNDSGEGGEISAEQIIEEAKKEEEKELEESQPVVIKASTPLPKYGDGGKFIPITIGVTILGIVLGHINPITKGIPSAAWERYLYIGFGLVLLFFGIKLIVESNTVAGLDENIRIGKLVTIGPFAWTRNPQYTGLIFICTALLFFSGNTFMYILPIGYYIFLTILMKRTEEPLLQLRFGKDYLDYCEKTNRVMPIKKR